MKSYQAFELLLSPLLISWQLSEVLMKWLHSQRVILMGACALFEICLTALRFQNGPNAAWFELSWGWIHGSQINVLYKFSFRHRQHQTSRQGWVISECLSWFLTFPPKCLLNWHFSHGGTVCFILSFIYERKQWWKHCLIEGRSGYSRDSPIYSYLQPLLRI